MCNICKAAKAGTSPYLIQSLGSKKRRTDQAKISVVLGAVPSSKISLEARRLQPPYALSVPLATPNLRK